MSTSLEKDLHSVYIDGEMPESFVSQYESIVSSSEKEKKALEKMQALHSLLQEDSESMTVSDSFTEESFARLQTKMRYAKNISYAGADSGSQKSFVTPFIKYASSFAAAAAVFAVVFIPIHYNSLANAKQTAVAAISIMKEKAIEPIAKKEVIIDGNINKEDLPKVLAVKTETKKSEQAPKVPAPEAVQNETLPEIAKSEDMADSTQVAEEDTLPVEQKTIYATNLASSYGERTVSGSNSPIGRRFRERLTAVDPFIPDFSSSSITISVPNFHEIGNNMEIMDFPDESGK